MKVLVPLWFLLTWLHAAAGAQTAHVPVHFGLKGTVEPYRLLSERRYTVVAAMSQAPAQPLAPAPALTEVGALILDWATRGLKIASADVTPVVFTDIWTISSGIVAPKAGSYCINLLELPSVKAKMDYVDLATIDSISVRLLTQSSNVDMVLRIIPQAYSSVRNFKSITYAQAVTNDSTSTLSWRSALTGVMQVDAVQLQWPGNGVSKLLKLPFPTPPPAHLMLTCRGSFSEPLDVLVTLHCSVAGRGLWQLFVPA